jgi:putative sigma-54 modulation protein
MEITIQSVNFDTSVSLNEFINKKLSKLEKFADNIRAAEVSLRVINTTDKANKEIGVKLLLSDGEFYASRTTEAYEDAVAQVADALERQIIKSKEKKQG